MLMRLRVWWSNKITIPAFNRKQQKLRAEREAARKPQGKMIQCVGHKHKTQEAYDLCGARKGKDE